MKKESIRIVISRNIKKYRKAKGLSQEKLALKCGMHHAYIGFIERQKHNPSVETIERIAAALEVTEAQIMER